MGWFEDAKKKVEDKASDATEAAKKTAAEQAGKAALAAATTAVSRSVGGFFEGVVSSAEEALAEAEARASSGPISPDAPEGDALGRAMREAVSTPDNLPLQHETPPPPPSDVYEEARRTLAMSRAARGLPIEEAEPSRSHPNDPVQAALDAASSARAHASSGGEAARAREQSAREQLAAMKASLGVPTSSLTADDDEPVPKKRLL